MIENTREFNEGYEQALRYLEDEKTHSFLLATAQWDDGEVFVHSQFSHNEKSPIPAEVSIRMIAALMVCLDHQSPDSLSDINQQVLDYAAQMRGEV